jgi:membrane protein DedA with SNARE-associated domain
MESFLEQLFNTAVSFADSPFAFFIFLFLAGFANFFFPPVPIELVTVFCGYLVSQGHTSLALVISAPTLGMFAGSVLCYRIALYFGAPILKKPFFARYITDDAVIRTRHWLEKYGAVTLFFAKFVPGVYLCVVVSSGILALKQTRIYTAFLLANLALFMLLAFIGKIGGEHWREVYAAVGKKGAVVIISTLLLCMFISIAVKVIRNIKQKKPELLDR